MEKKINPRDLITGAISDMEERIKHGKLKIKRIKAKAKAMKPYREDIKDVERELSCKHARLTAHTPLADARREISNEVRKDIV